MTMRSPVGILVLVATEEALVQLSMVGAGTPPAADPPDPAHPVLGRAVAELEAYFAGELTAFGVPLAAEGTEFQHRVWAALCEIPYGETRSYVEIARAIGQPTASRAVGAANGRNPIGILVPCHRVIGASGDLTGYGGGMPAKRWLLDHERRIAGPPTLF